MKQSKDSKSSDLDSPKRSANESFKAWFHAQVDAIRQTQPSAQAYQRRIAEEAWFAAGTIVTSEPIQLTA